VQGFDDVGGRPYRVFWSTFEKNGNIGIAVFVCGAERNGTMQVAKDYPGVPKRRSLVIIELKH